MSQHVVSMVSTLYVERHNPLMALRKGKGLLETVPGECILVWGKQVIM